MLRHLLLVLVLPALAAPALAAGDVTVVIDAELDVIVTGDGEDNDIVLEAEGKLAIRGRNGTTVNGSTEAFLLPTPIRGRYLVDLGNGDDRFETSTVMTSGSVIRTGNGADRVGIGNCVVPGKGLTIETGEGDDVVGVEDSLFSVLKIFTRDGHDDVNFFFASADALILHTGDGDDTADLRECVFDHATLFGGRGDDFLTEDEVLYLVPPPKIVGFDTSRLASP